MTAWTLVPLRRDGEEYAVHFGDHYAGVLELPEAMHADVVARLTAEADSDPETCPLDHTCDEDGVCDCWCEVHDCPASECPSFKLVDSWLRDAAEKRDAEVAQIRAELAEANAKVEVLMFGDKAMSVRIWLNEEIQRLKVERSAARLELAVARAAVAKEIAADIDTMSGPSVCEWTKGEAVATALDHAEPQPVPPVPDVDGHGGGESA